MNKTEKKQAIADIIYNNLGYMYCDNCRFGSEISEEESNENFGYWGCEDCHRKYNGWGISKSVSNSLAKGIMKICSE